MSSAVKPPANYNDFGSLRALARDSKTGSAGSIRETARQFESLFTRMVLKSVRDANLGDPLFGDDAMKSYQEMYDDQLSVQLTAGKGIGLAEMLVRQLSRGVGTASGPAAAANGTDAAEAASGGAESVTGAGIALPAGAPGRSRKGSPYAPGAGAVGSTAAATAVTGSTAASLTPTATAAATAAGTAAVATAGVAGSGEGTAATTADDTADAAHAAFVRELWPSAVQAGEQLGVDPRTLIAHAALETGWGRSLPGDGAGPCSNNLFGIKAGRGSGPSVASRTLEFDGGVASVRTERFRAYASTADCFQDYVALLQGSPRYAGALRTGSNAAAFGAALQQGGYATDPRYGSKLAAVANSLKQIAWSPLTTSQGGT